MVKVEKGMDGTCYRCGRPGHFQYECKSNGRNSWRGSREGGQQQARGGACFQQQQRDDDSRSRGNGGYRSRGNGGYHSRGRGQRCRGGQQRQDRPAPNVFITKLEVSENNNVEVNNYKNKLEWILDSGCSDRIVNDGKYFVKFKTLENPINVKVGDGRTLKATSIGDIKTKFVTNYNETEIILTNVFFIKEMDRNLISFGKIAEKAKIVSVGNTSKIYSDAKLIGIANKVNNLYKINTVFGNSQGYVTENVNNVMILKEKYHRMFGHVNFSYLNILSKNNLVEGLPNNLESEYLKCGTRVQNKMSNTRFENDRHKWTAQYNTIGFRGEKYFLVVVDDYSKVAKFIR